MTEAQLGVNERHLLRLASQGADEDGWATVSRIVWPLLAKVPEELLEREWLEGAEKGRCRLTDRGEAVLIWGMPA